MNKTYLYFNDEYLYIYSTKIKEIKKYTLPKNVVINGKIANINKFITKYESMLKEYHLNQGLIGDKLKVIVHPKYYPSDITLLKNIFEKINYRKVVIDNELKYYKLNEKRSWININNTYLIVSYINEYKKTISIFIEKDFFNTKTELYKYIKTKIGNRDIYLFGNNTEEIYKDYEKIYKNKTYLFADSEYYILKCLTTL